jgi:hypothetical protein
MKYELGERMAGSWETIMARAGTGHGEHRDTAARGVCAGKNDELGLRKRRRSTTAHGHGR